MFSLPPPAAFSLQNPCDNMLLTGSPSPHACTNTCVLHFSLTETVAALTATSPGAGRSFNFSASNTKRYLISHCYTKVSQDRATAGESSQITSGQRGHSPDLPEHSCQGTGCHGPLTPRGPPHAVNSVRGKGDALQEGSYKPTTQCQTRSCARPAVPRPTGTRRAHNLPAARPPAGRRMTPPPRPARAPPIPFLSGLIGAAPPTGGGDGYRGREEAAALSGCRAARGGAGGARGGPLAERLQPAAVGARVEDGRSGRQLSGRGGRRRRRRLLLLLRRRRRPAG